MWDRLSSRSGAPLAQRDRLESRSHKLIRPTLRCSVRRTALLPLGRTQVDRPGWFAYRPLAARSACHTDYSHVPRERGVHMREPDEAVWGGHWSFEGRWTLRIPGISAGCRSRLWRRFPAEKCALTPRLTNLLLFCGHVTVQRKVAINAWRRHLACIVIAARAGWKPALQTTLRCTVRIKTPKRSSVLWALREQLLQPRSTGLARAAGG